MTEVVALPTQLSAALLGFSPGAVGGVCNVLVGHPIDLLKVRQQTGGGALGTLVRNVLVKDGPRGFYAGVAAPLLAVVPAFAISFASYDLAERGIRRYTHKPADEKMSLPETALAGGFSGVPLAFVLGPLERIKCLMQIQHFPSFQACVQQVYSEGGLRSIFRGTMLTMSRDVPGNAAYFAGYEGTKRMLPEPNSLSSTLFAGGMAGVCNWIVAIPMDVIKSRWQTAAPGTYTSPSHVLRQLLATEGPSALAKGIGPALLRAFPANAACLAGVETMRTLLRDVQ